MIDQLWDGELCIAHMKALRGWSAGRTNTDCNQLKLIPDLDRYYSGLDGAFQLGTPAHLIGEVSKGSKRLAFQLQQLEHTTKANPMMAEEDEVILEELTFGLEENASLCTAPASSWSRPLPAGTVTSLAYDSSIVGTIPEILRSAAKSVASSPGAANSATDSCGATTPSPIKTAPARDGTPGAKQPKKGCNTQGVGELALAIPRIILYLTQSLSSSLSKLETQMQSCCLVLPASDMESAAPFISVIKQRFVVASHCLGSNMCLQYGARADGSVLQPITYATETVRSKVALMKSYTEKGFPEEKGEAHWNQLSASQGRKKELQRGTEYLTIRSSELWVSAGKTYAEEKA